MFPPHLYISSLLHCRFWPGAAWEQEKTLSMQEVIGETERRERRTTLMMELRVKIILQGVRKPPHWFSIQTLDDTGWHCTWPLPCWPTQLSAWEIRWCEISELTVGFLIRVKFSIEELFSSYVFIKHWHSDTTLWQLHRITRWLPLLPPLRQEMISDTNTSSIIQMEDFSSVQFTASYSAHECWRKLSHFTLPASSCFLVVDGSLLSC